MIQELKETAKLTLLRNIIDDQLKFDKHIDILYKNIARQINILYIFNGIFYTKKREVFHNTFILANFS